MAPDAYALILCMLLLGALFARLGLFDASAAEVLNNIVLYVCLPAAVLRYAPNLNLHLDLLALIAVPWALLLATVLVLRWLRRPLRLSDDQYAVLLLTVALGNTSFLGYPLVRALLGEDALPYAVVYDQFGAFMMLSTFGLYVLARYGGDCRPDMATILRRMLRFPPFVALLLALSVMPAQPPTFIAGALQCLSDALLPLVMLALGIGLRLRLPANVRRPLTWGLALKMVLLPGLALALAVALGLSGQLARVAVLQAAMPPMITAAALAVAHRLAPALAVVMVGYGIVLSLLTLPVWAWVTQRVFSGV